MNPMIHAIKSYKEWEEKRNKEYVDRVWGSWDWRCVISATVFCPVCNADRSMSTWYITLKDWAVMSYNCKDCACSIIVPRNAWWDDTCNISIAEYKKITCHVPLWKNRISQRLRIKDTGWEWVMPILWFIEKFNFT